jgi:hypothetical protein
MDFGDSNCGQGGFKGRVFDATVITEAIAVVNFSGFHKDPACCLKANHAYTEY